MKKGAECNLGKKYAHLMLHIDEGVSKVQRKTVAIVTTFATFYGNTHNKFLSGINMLLRC